MELSFSKSKKTPVIILVLFLFCAIYTPCFFPVSMGVITLGLSCIYIFLHIRNININKNALLCLLAYLPFVVYFSIIQFYHFYSNGSLSNMYFSTIKDLVTIFLSALIYPVFILMYCKNNKINKTEFFYVLSGVLFIQLVCVVLAFLFPPVRQFFFDLIIKNLGNERIVNVIKYTSKTRSYGLSSNLFDQFGYISALLIVITFAFGLKKRNTKIIGLSLVSLIIPLLNARSGVVLACLGIFIVFLFYFDFRNIFKYIFIGIIGLLLLILLITKLPEGIREWILSGVKEIVSFVFHKDASGELGVILYTNMIFPDNFIFGAGYATDIVDNGYVKCIWNFGLIGTILYLFGYLFLFIYSFKTTKSKFYKSLFISFAVLFFVYTIKIYHFRYLGANILVLGLPVLYLCKYLNDDII